MKPKVIFFGNGPLANYALEILEPACTILFHAKTKEDLETVQKIKRDNPDALGILASFGVLIKQDTLDLFEPEGILNIHPSLLPLYRGASPIESAILNGDNTFSVSIMKLVQAMDAGPIYFQKTIIDLPLNKTEIYKSLAHAGASWLRDNLKGFLDLHNSPEKAQLLFPEYHAQDEEAATFTKKLDKTMSNLTPEIDSAETTLRKIVAFQTFPKPKYKFYDHDVIILSAHIENNCPNETNNLFIKCTDNRYVVVDRLQPLSRKPMDAKSFLNGLR